jgi:hypothetical protein
MDTLVSKPWTPEEDALLIKQYRLVGAKWADIGKMLNGRSGSNVKNRWYKHLKKNPEAMRQVAEGGEGGSTMETPAGNTDQTVGISDCHWGQILASLEKDAPFDAFWATVFSI